MIREINDESYEREVIEPGGTVLLLAYAPWCGDCQRILPVFKDLSGLPEYQEVCFLQTDMVKNIRTKKTLGVERYPTLCLFRNGRQVAEKVAEAPKEEQRAIIESLLRDCGSTG
ncbi:MAG: thioredoxin family protein [Deltaproteobacteria bacterium]|nr:thioredoxin family protein [Deltaproteobacteria bacterium]